MYAWSANSPPLSNVTDGLDGIGEGSHQLDDGAGDRPFRLALDGDAFHLARQAFHQGDNRAAMISTNDGIAFPVAKGVAGIDFGGSLVNVDTVREHMGGAATFARTPPFVVLA